MDAPVSTYVSWVFGEVAPSLAGGALGRLAAWAAQRARALEADGRLDDALLIAREAHDSIGDRCGAGAVACGNDGDAWLADSDAADAQKDIAELRSALERVAALRDAHGVDAQLGEWLRGTETRPGAVGEDDPVVASVLRMATTLMRCSGPSGPGESGFAFFQYTPTVPSSEPSGSSIGPP